MMETIAALPFIYKLCIVSSLMLFVSKLGFGDILVDFGRIFGRYGALTAQGIIVLIVLTVMVSVIGSIGYFAYSVF